MKRVIFSRSIWEFIFSGTQAISAVVIMGLTVFGLLFTDAPKLLIEALRAEKSEAILEKNVALQEITAAKKELDAILNELAIQRENLVKAQEYSRSYFKEVRQILTADLHQKLLDRTRVLRSQLIAARDYPIFEKYSGYIQSIPVTVAASKRSYEEKSKAWNLWHEQAGILHSRLSEEGIGEEEIRLTVQQQLGDMPEKIISWRYSQIEEFRKWPGKRVPQWWESIAFQHFSLDEGSHDIARKMRQSYLANLPNLNDVSITGEGIILELFSEQNLEPLTDEHLSSVLKLLKDFQRQHQTMLQTQLMVPYTPDSEPLWVSELQYVVELRLSDLDQFEQLAVNFILGLDNALI